MNEKTTYEKALKELRKEIELADYVDEEYRGGLDINLLKTAIKALEKQIPKKPIHHEKKYGRHKWKLNSKGEIDEFAFDYDIHAGVVCERCGRCVCTSCEPDYDDLNDCEQIKDTCPSCGAEVLEYEKQKCCDNCGQALDWEVEENDRT